ncbi:MAG TPA: hypothetical protein PKY50_18375, partial [Candidatus Competibacter sp.]|nr:hypothetical protein [Candidatus Competibacter sp.]
RGPVAVFAARVPKLEDGVVVFLALATEWGLGPRAVSAATFSSPGARSKRLPDGGGDRQPKRQDLGKRGPRGFDSTKKVNGRKRFAASDVMGNLLESLVLPANTGERAGVWSLLEREDGADSSREPMKGSRVSAGKRRYRPTLTGRSRSSANPKIGVGFAVLPRRRIIEQTFGRWSRHRRLSEDYEQNPACRRAMLVLTAIRRALRYLKPAPSHDPSFKTRNP